MGTRLNDKEAAYVATSLNYMFTTGLNATVADVKMLRGKFAGLLNPAAGKKRHQSLRFGALLLNDHIAFDGSYPADTYKRWLRWLTWFNIQPDNGQHSVNGTVVAGKPHDIIAAQIAQALAANPPIPIEFTWSRGETLKVSVTKTAAKVTIIVNSLGQRDFPDSSDDEDA